MTLIEAFEHMLNDKEAVVRSGMASNNKRLLLFKLKKNPMPIRDDTMRDWLRLAGYKEVAKWTAPKRK